MTQNLDNFDLTWGRSLEASAVVALGLVTRVSSLKEDY